MCSAARCLMLTNGLVRSNVMIGIDQDSGKIRSVEFNYIQDKIMMI